LKITTDKKNYHRSNESIDYNDKSFFLIKWAEGKGGDGRDHIKECGLM
jgi:hypothetical protein